MAAHYGSFLDWLQQRAPGTLSLQDVAHFVRQAADDLQYAHDLGLIHGNVDLSSFLIRNNSEQPQIPDLLIAEFRQPNPTPGISTTSQPTSSNPLYMSPEQWVGTAVPASDQYALAVMAYQLLTWHSPFQGTQEQMMHQHLYVQPQPPSMLNPRIPPALDAVLLRALAKRPEDRFPSIAAFANAFQQALQAPGPIPMQAQPAAFAPNFNSDRTIINRLSRSSQIKEILILGVVFLVVVSSIGFGFFSIVKSNQAAAAHITAAATLTANALPLASTFTNGTPIFTDLLSSNTNNRWDEKATCVFRDGTYHVLVQEANHLEACGLNTETFADAAIQVDVSLLAGDRTGLIFRFDSKSRHAYIFDITNEGAFFFASDTAPLIPPTKTSAIAPVKQKNTLLIFARGSDFKFFINDIFVGEAHDSTSSSGQIGFFVKTLSTSTHGDGSFSNLKVFKV